MIGARITSWWRTLLWLTVVAITLAAGLRPEDYDFRNHVETTADGAGLAFSRYGVAFTPPFLAGEGPPAAPGFTIALTIGPEAAWQDGFALIAQIHDGHDRSQLILGRWHHHLIVMNGADYAGLRRRPRLSARSVPSPDAARAVAVTSGPGGTRLYIDGEVAGKRGDLRLRIPRESPGGRIVLGNSVAGTHSWTGVIREFALYDRPLDRGEIEALARAARGDTTPSPPPPEGARIEYRMADYTPGEPGIVASRGADPVALQVPPRCAIVEKRFLQNPFAHDLVWNRGFFIDVAVNLLGFIPFGLTLTLLLAGLGVRGVRSLVIVIAATTALSGGIEILQAWLPSRTSSLLDLALNIPSGVAGALIVALGRRFTSREPASGPPPG